MDTTLIDLKTVVRCLAAGCRGRLKPRGMSYFVGRYRGCLRCGQVWADWVLRDAEVLDVARRKRRAGAAGLL